MPENVQNILNKGKEWWTKFSTRQKTLAISITAALMIALVILAVVMNQPHMVTLVECDDLKQASEVQSLLNEEGIKFKVSSDGLTFSINEKDSSTANILLGSNEIPTAGYDLDRVFDGGFSTTESDKSKKYQLYLESKFADQLESISSVEEASVSLSIPPDDGTIIHMDQETYASVILTLNSALDDEQVAGIAQFIATEVGNDSTDKIRIIDSNGNLLFSGADTNTTMGSANSQLAIQNKAENMVRSEVKSLVLGTAVYDNVEVSLKLDMDFDSKEYVNHRYYLDEGFEEHGPVESESVFESEATGGEAGTPGTVANDDPTYVVPDGETTSSSVSEAKRNYLTNEEIEKNTSNGASIDYANSSISVVATSYVVYDEKALKADGTLGDMTFDEFVAQNSDRIKTTVDDDFYDAVANATGIPVENISFIAYDVPFFKYASSSGRDVADYLQILLAVLIFALLGFVVFKSTRKQQEEVIEPELSVESLLETTKEASQEGLEDIGYAEKSETRILIEKFVEENPEAAATLLRNWLNEEWE